MFPLLESPKNIDQFSKLSRKIHNQHRIILKITHFFSKIKTKNIHHITQTIYHLLKNITHRDRENLNHLKI